MPLYEYQCSHCKNSCEALQKVSEGPLVICPNCGKDTLHRQVSAPHFQLKGSGWYETDFKHKEKPKEKPEGSNSAEITSENKPESKAESKAETKTTTEKKHE